jgi:tryptophan 2,3-dioxygenase
LRNLDVAVNVNWLLVHIGAAQRYLMVKKNAVKATGGTNWREFLPPSFQRISFFPELWNEEEKEEWGKQWVEEMITQ